MKNEILLPTSISNLDQYLDNLLDFWKTYSVFACKYHILDLKSEAVLAEFRQQLPEDCLEFIDQNSVDIVEERLSGLLCGASNDNVEEAGGQVGNCKLPVGLQMILNACLRLQLPLSCNFEYFGLEITDLDDKDLHLNVTKLGMGSKKLHEVSRTVQLLTQLASKHSVEYFVDVGCGMGYLSHWLGSHLPVIGLEIDALIVQAAKKRTSMRKHRHNELPNVEYIVLDVVGNSLQSLEESSEIVREVGGIEGGAKAMIISLHACGDLSAKTALSNLESNHWIKGLVTVGCCYHLMDTSLFPNSAIMQRQGFKFTKGALKLAQQTFTSFSSARLKSLWHSQTLDIIAAINSTSSSVNTLNTRKRVNTNLIPLNPDNHTGFIKKHVILLSTIRNYIGRVVESMVLIDRYLLGKEMGLDCFLIRLYNNEKSPRSFCFGAFKK